MVRGGNVDVDAGALRGTVYAGLYWSSTAGLLAPYAYILDFYDSNIRPSRDSDRWNGFTVGGFWLMVRY